MPEQKNPTGEKKKILKMKNFMFDHKGCKFPGELESKEKEHFYFRSSDSQVKN